MNADILTQEKFLQIMIPVFKLNGIAYQKVKAVMARKAKTGERIDTITSDGLETTNVVIDESYIIKNQTEAGEMYIIKEQKFRERYEFHKSIDSDYSIYKAKGKIIALQMTVTLLNELNLEKEFFFIAPWGEAMIVKSDDFLATTFDYSEVYRIARKEFFETYQIL